MLRSPAARTGPDGAAQVHSRGQVRTGATVDEMIDIPALRSRCSERRDAEQHYARFTREGVLYGSHFTSVEEVQHNDREALATLVGRGAHGPLPAGVLDGAIQSVGALEPDDEEQRPSVPFAMDEIRVLGPIPERSLAYVRQHKSGECDVYIVDVDGQPPLHVHGLDVGRQDSPDHFLMPFFGHLRSLTMAHEIKAPGVVAGTPTRPLTQKRSPGRVGAAGRGGYRIHAPVQ